MTSEAYQEALKNAAKTMVRVRNPRRLLKMITRFIVREVQLTHASVLIHEAAKNRYVFVDSKGGQRIPTSLVCLDRNSPLIEWFLVTNSKFTREHLFYKDIETWLGDPGIAKQGPEFKTRIQNLRNAMLTLKASVCIPGF